jgi:uncharacterized protein (TIGR02598 family)
MKFRTRNAFSLVEVTLALGVAAFSLLVIYSLLPVGLQTNRRAIEQTASVDILSAVAADLRATPVTTPRGNATTSPQFGINIPAAGNAGTTTLFFNGTDQFAKSQQPDSRYRVTMRFVSSSGGGSKTATLADVRVTWPAGASITNAQGTAEMFAAFDRN